MNLAAIILYQTDTLMVLNKPEGLLVHPVATDSVALTDFLDKASGWRPAHRLDRDTSGCLVVARGQELGLLGRYFIAGRIEKIYHAMVAGTLQGAGEITTPLGKHNSLMVADPHGQAAHTLWQALHTTQEQTFVQLAPKTGRTHQLRAHLASIGHPIIGDIKYAGPPAARMMLHASSLNIPGHPLVQAPCPF